MLTRSSSGHSLASIRSGGASLREHTQAHIEIVSTHTQAHIEIVRAHAETGHARDLERLDAAP
eukprot:2437729-Pleurochrysis_carterae.AAC.1